MRGFAVAHIHKRHSSVCKIGDKRLGLLGLSNYSSKVNSSIPNHVQSMASLVSWWPLPQTFDFILKVKQSSFDNT